MEGSARDGVPVEGSRALENIRAEGSYPDGVRAGAGHTEGSHAAARCGDDDFCTNNPAGPDHAVKEKAIDVEKRRRRVVDGEAGHRGRLVVRSPASGGHGYAAKRHQCSSWRPRLANDQ